MARLLREADRDLAKGLTVSDICRKVGIAEGLITDGDSSVTRSKSTRNAALANWRSRWNASSGSSPNCSWTNRCSRTSQKKPPQQNLWVDSGSGRRPRL